MLSVTNHYAQNLILVNLVLVNFFGFLIIARYHTTEIWRKLEETFLSASRSFLNQMFKIKPEENQNLQTEI